MNTIAKNLKKMKIELNGRIISFSGKLPITDKLISSTMLTINKMT